MKVDDYEIENFISKGAFSEVYLANKKDDLRKYAVKKISR